MTSYWNLGEQSPESARYIYSLSIKKSHQINSNTVHHFVESIIFWVFFFICVDRIQLDKASTIKDAIDYIQDLQEQERNLQAEIMELESESLKKDPGFDFEEELPILLRSKKSRCDQIYDHRVPMSRPIEVHEVSRSLFRIGLT